MLVEKRFSATSWLRNIKFYIFCIFVLLAPISKGVLEVAFALILFLWIAENALTKKWKIWKYFPKTKLNLPIAVLMAVLFFSVFNSVNFPLSLRKFFSKWVELAMIYFFTVDILDSRKKLNVVLGIVSATLSLILIDGLWQSATGVDFLRSYPIEGFWIRGYFSGLNIFGAFLILLAPIVISFLVGFREKKAIKVCGLFILGLTVVCLALNCSIVSWAATITAFAIASFFSKRKIIKIIPVLMLLFIFIVSLNPTFKARISEAVYSSIYSYGGRITIWKEYLQEIMINPILGKGLSTTTVQIAEKYSKLPLVIKANPHSWYLLIALEAGFLGLIAYLWFLQRVFKIFFSSKRDLLWCGLSIGFLSFVLVNIADNIWDERVQCSFWMIIGLVVVHSKLNIAGNEQLV